MFVHTRTPATLAQEFNFRAAQLFQIKVTYLPI